MRKGSRSPVLRLAGVLSIVALTVAGCTTSSAPSDASGTEGDALPLVPTFGSELHIGSVEQLAAGADAVFVGELVEIRPKWRLPLDEEGSFDGISEMVGLVFVPDSVLSGSLVDDKEVIVGWHGYTLDHDGERRARRSFNGLEFSDDLVGERLLVPVTFVKDIDSYMLYNTGAVARVQTDSVLLPLGDDGFFVERETTSLAELESQIAGSPRPARRQDVGGLVDVD